ncbi:MAG: Gfo/Idh/MocA family oxidoreductase [Acidobacteria bacterium]|nr:MAG: Gfo/Idh/MocA family oxidoreductase [Acidobacteriota bacterium]
MAEKIRVAVLGTGSIGARHIQVLGDAGFEPIAISVRAPGTTGGAPAGTLAARDLSEAAAMGASRCVVATDTGRHLADTLEAIGCGYDVLVEKPLSVDASAAREICHAAASAGRRAFTAFVFRFSDSLNRFRELLPNAGQLHAVRVECQSYLPDWRPNRPYRDTFAAREAEGGVLRDLSHELDYAGWLFGWPDKVQGRLRNTGRLGIQADESVDAAWEGAGGCEVSLRIDYLTRQTRRRVTADGDQGSLVWDAIRNTVTWLAPGQAPVEESRPQERNAMFAAELQAFLAATAGSAVGHDPRIATAEDGFRSLALSDAIRLSSRTRREEAIEYSL